MGVTLALILVCDQCGKSFAMGAHTGLDQLLHLATQDEGWIVQDKFTGRLTFCSATCQAAR